MNTIFDAIVSRVQDSTLLPDQKYYLLEAISRASEVDQQNFLELFSEDGTWVIRLGELLQAKTAVLNAGNNTAWEKILQTENELLTNIEQ